VPDPAFLSPLGAAVAVVALVPIAALGLRERRARQIRHALRLGSPPPRLHLPAALAGAAALALLAAAAAQPALRVPDARRERSDAEAFLVVDISRSMAASAHAGSRTRLDRAIAAAKVLRAELTEIPIGVASLTDRVLPHIFPTTMPGAVEEVLGKTLGINRPPPQSTELDRATRLSALQDLGFEGFFSPGAKHRLIILLSDGESSQYYPLTLAVTLRQDHVQLVIVRIWGSRERIHLGHGQIDSYRPDPTATAPLAELAKLTGSPRFFDDHSLQAAAGQAQHDLGAGPTVAAGRATRTIPLDRYVVLAAALPLGFVLARRNLV
jgi:hypothetical protein